MNSIWQLGLGLHWDNSRFVQLRRWFARPTLTSPPQQPDYLYKRPPSWAHKRDSKKGCDLYTLKSFWKRNKGTIVVGCAIGLCCCEYVCEWIAHKRAGYGHRAFLYWLRRNFVNSVQNLREGRWWVPLSSSLAHPYLAHLALNVRGLWGVGRIYATESVPLDFVNLWILSAACCSRAEIHWQTVQKGLGTRISGYEGNAGASGVVCGLMGYFLCSKPEMPVEFYFSQPMPLWLGAFVFVAGSVYYMFTGFLPSMGHAGHLGGFMAGIAHYHVQLACNYGILRFKRWRSGRRSGRS